MDASPTGTQKVPRRAVHRPPQTRSSRDGGHPPGTCRALRRGLATGFGPWIVCAHVQGCGLSAESVAAKLITEDLAVLPLGPFDRKNHLDLPRETKIISSVQCELNGMAMIAL